MKLILLYIFIFNVFAARNCTQNYTKVIDYYHTLNDKSSCLSQSGNIELFIKYNGIWCNNKCELHFTIIGDDYTRCNYTYNNIIYEFNNYECPTVYNDNNEWYSTDNKLYDIIRIIIIIIALIVFIVPIISIITHTIKYIFHRYYTSSLLYE